MPLPDDQNLLDLCNDLLAQFDAIFGVHPGFRPAHAKGALVVGTFKPSWEAVRLSCAPHFRQPLTPVTVRFSNSTGLPLVADNDPNSDPRGMAVRFHLGEHRHTDIVSHSFDGFPTRTGQEFLGFLKAVASTEPGKPSDPAHPSPIEQFLATHPAALAFVQAPKPAPSSFARSTYFGVNAMHFSNADGGTRFGRYRLVPVAGEEHLDLAAAKALGSDYLFEELTARLAKRPIEFRLVAQLAGDGDVVDDATIHWPADRPLQELGTLSLRERVPHDEAEQRRIIFDPIPRVDGIEPSADPLLELRAAIYLISGRRRRAAAPVGGAPH